MCIHYTGSNWFSNVVARSNGPDDRCLTSTDFCLTFGIVITPSNAMMEESIKIKR